MKRVALGEHYDAEEVADQFQVPVDDLAPLAGWAAKQWRERLSSLFPNPKVEEEIEFLDDGDSVPFAPIRIILTGHPDLWTIADGEIRLLDYKSGFLDLDASAQLKGYAKLLLEYSQARYPVRATKFNVREGRLHTELWTPEMLDAWWAWLKRHLQDTGIYRPGEHCGRCPRAMECNAHGEQMTQLVAMLCGDPLPIGDMAETAAATVESVRLLEKRCEQFRETVKAHVAAKGGSWGPLKIAETHPRKIDVSRGQQVLIETIGAERLLQLVKVSNGDLEAAVKETAPPRGKGAAVKQLFSRLEEAGAITTTTTTKLEVKRNGSQNGTATAIGAAADA